MKSKPVPYVLELVIGLIWRVPRSRVCLATCLYIKWERQQKNLIKVLILGAMGWTNKHYKITQGRGCGGERLCLSPAFSLTDNCHKTGSVALLGRVITAAP